MNDTLYPVICDKIELQEIPDLDLAYRKEDPVLMGGESAWNCS